MKCEDYQEWLSLYVDDELRLDEKQQLEKHLEHCLSCSETLETLKMMKSLIKELKEAEVPETFHNDLHQRLQEEIEPKNKKYRWLSYVSGLVAACLIVFVLVEGGVDQELPIQDTVTPMTVSTEHQRALPATLENEADETSKQSRAISTIEEVWKVKVSNLSEIQKFIREYVKQTAINLETWQEDRTYHMLLEPVEDKESFKQKLQLEKGVEEIMDITEAQTSKLHLIFHLQE